MLKWDRLETWTKPLAVCFKEHLWLPLKIAVIFFAMRPSRRLGYWHPAALRRLPAKSDRVRLSTNL
jgi:hypothetical protein